MVVIAGHCHLAPGQAVGAALILGTVKNHTKSALTYYDKPFVCTRQILFLDTPPGEYGKKPPAFHRGLHSTIQIP
jgi:hypothetical protein